MGARAHNFDRFLEMKDAGAVVASAPAQVAAVNRILDMQNARFEGVVRIGISAIAVGADNAYDIIVQGSNSASFASGIENLAMLNLGNTAVRAAGAQTSVVGEYEIPVTNEEFDTVFRYIRLFTRVAGTAPSISYTAFLASEFGG